MSRKIARTIEQEIEKARGDSRWDDIPKLFKDLDFSKSSLSEPYKDLVSCELQVEKLFAKYHLKAPQDGPLQAYLAKLKGNLGKLYEEKQELTSVAVETLFLLCKVNFMLQEYDTALHCIDKIEQDPGNFHGHRRRFKMAADMFAIKGIVLEELQYLSSNTISDEDIIESFESATNCFLKLLLAGDSKSSLPRSPSAYSTAPEHILNIGEPLEIAFQRSSILNIRQGHIDKAVERLRYLVRSLEDKSVQKLREILVEQLVDILLQGVCDKSYIAPKTTDSLSSPSKHSLSSSSSKSHLFDTSLFIPQNITEDVILLLLLKETLVLQQATSSIAPEESKCRERTMVHANYVYNLLTIGLVRSSQFPLLVECLERAMKLAFEQFHLWFQYGLALANAHKFEMAVLVLKQCHELQPDNAMVLLHSAKIHLNHLHQFDEALEIARSLIELGPTVTAPFLGKSYLALGIGCCGKATTVLTNREKQRLHCEGVQAFEKCLECDPHDKEALFHLALTQSLLRKTIKALRNAYAALKLDCNYLLALQLIVLLLSSKKKYREALDACDTALLEYPDDFVLLLIKVKLEEVWFGGDQALTTCKRLLGTWKRLYDDDLQSAPILKRAGSGLIDKIVSDKRSLKNMSLVELGSDQDETSSIGASVRLESTLSGEAGSLSTCQISLPAALSLQARIWLTVAGVYSNLSKDSEAKACVKEANLVFPLSPDVLFQQGQIYENQENYSEAKKCYENAISINPNHANALQHLGIVYYKMNNYTMSEKVLRDAINTDPTLHTSWHNLGMVQQARDEHESASECLMTAIDLEATCPILPFTIIPRIM